MSRKWIWDTRGATSLVVIFFVAFLVFMAVSTHMLIGQNEKVPETEETKITTFEKCIKTKDSYTYDADDGLLCTVNDQAFLPKLSSCSDAGWCKEINLTFENYCNDQYKSLLPTTEKPSSYRVKYDIDYHEGNYRPTKKWTPSLKDGYVHARFRCSAVDTAHESELMDVFLRREGRNFVHHLTVKEPKLCKKIDNKGIPVALAGICYDKNARSFRVTEP